MVMAQADPVETATDDGVDEIVIPDGRPPGWLQNHLQSPVVAAMRRMWDFTIEGLENVPPSGPVLLTPNHLAFIDSPIVMALNGRRTLAVGKGEYMDSWKTRYTFPAMGMVPINRGGGKAALETLNQVAAFLLAGNAFLIYPEGTRSRDGKLHRGRTGAARLALQTGALVVPVGLIGTDSIQPIDTTIPKFGMPCTVRFGDPIDVRARSGGENNRRILRSITDELMYEISELSEQEYSDTYGDEIPEAKKN